jgi:hypothetical protein
MPRRALVLALAALAVSATADAALPKPKPWQWKPEKVVARLTAASPINGGEIGGNILSARCTGQGAACLDGSRGSHAIRVGVARTAATPRS